MTDYWVTVKMRVTLIGVGDIPPEERATAVWQPQRVIAGTTEEKIKKVWHNDSMTRLVQFKSVSVEEID